MERPDFAENQIFMFRLLTAANEEEAMTQDIDYGDIITVKPIFNAANQDKKFHMEIQTMESPIGIEVRGYGDAPPNIINDAIISYIMTETQGMGQSPLVAVGELIFMMCLHYAAHYYVKLPYQGEDHNSRYFIQPCGRPGDRHYHTIELDDVTRTPVDLERDMKHVNVASTMGEALDTIAGDYFTTVHREMRENVIDRAVNNLTNKVKKEPKDQELQDKVDEVINRKEAVKERDEERTTEIPDIFLTAFNDDDE